MDDPQGLGSVRFVGTNTFLRIWPVAMLLVSLLAVSEPGGVGRISGVLLVVLVVVSSRLLPWRFAVVDNGLALWFPFGRRRFLAKDRVVVRVRVGGAIALPSRRRVRYPLSDGFVERRLPELRAILAEHGFDVA